MITLIIYILITILPPAMLFLDLFKKIDLSHKAFMSIFLAIVPHVFIVIYFSIYFSSEMPSFTIWKYFLICESMLFILYLWLKHNIRTYSKKQIEDTRLRILYGGRCLILYSIYAAFSQIFIYYFASIYLSQYEIPNYILVIDTIVSITSIVTLYINGMLRILFTSRRLNIIKKVITVCIMFIPFLNIVAIVYVSRAVKLEYEHESYRVINQNMIIDSAVCKTKYPLVLIHGLGFRDFKYINYWGRIPKDLIRNGATVYYGNQEAFGTVEYNAQDIKNKILEVVEQTGCQKVNIIAHSKGGLDSRYMISSLNMESYVASLTMISVPNHGSKLADFVYTLPKWFYHATAKFINNYFALIGDKNPDFYTALNQLSTHYSKTFNETIPDSEKVYYQSYAVVMRNMFSDYILTVPYTILRILGGENDGLVEIESAKWGKFKGVIRNKYNRGISHGDIIDLRKDNYKGFDVRNQYIKIVSELKNEGF